MNEQELKLKLINKLSECISLLSESDDYGGYSAEYIVDRYICEIYSDNWKVENNVSMD